MKRGRTRREEERSEREKKRSEEEREKKAREEKKREGEGDPELKRQPRLTPINILLSRNTHTHTESMHSSPMRCRTISHRNTQHTAIYGGGTDPEVVQAVAKFPRSPCCKHNTDKPSRSLSCKGASLCNCSLIARWKKKIPGESGIEHMPRSCHIVHFCSICCAVVLLLLLFSLYCSAIVIMFYACSIYKIVRF